jgi:hypothetical protein
MLFGSTCVEDSVEHTNGYSVLILLGVLLYIGVNRCFPREVRPGRPLLTPVIFLATGFSSLGALFPHAGSADLFITAMTVTAGAGLGWLHACRWALQYRTGPSGLLVRLPGDPSMLVLIVLTFASESFMHYAVESGQPWAATDTFAAVSFAMWGVLVGMPLGRALNVVMRCIQYANGVQAG